jgi:hypothetical protein
VAGWCAGNHVRLLHNAGHFRSLRQKQGAVFWSPWCQRSCLSWKPSRTPRIKGNRRACPLLFAVPRRVKRSWGQMSDSLQDHGRSSIGVELHVRGSRPRDGCAPVVSQHRNSSPLADLRIPPAPIERRRVSPLCLGWERFFVFEPLGLRSWPLTAVNVGLGRFVSFIFHAWSQDQW